MKLTDGLTRPLEQVQKVSKITPIRQTFRESLSILSHRFKSPITTTGYNRQVQPWSARLNFWWSNCSSCWWRSRSWSRSSWSRSYSCWGWSCNRCRWVRRIEWKRWGFGCYWQLCWLWNEWRWISSRRCTGRCRWMDNFDFNKDWILYLLYRQLWLPVMQQNSQQHGQRGWRISIFIWIRWVFGATQRLVSSGCIGAGWPQTMLAVNFRLQMVKIRHWTCSHWSSTTWSGTDDRRFSREQWHVLRERCDCE